MIAVAVEKIFIFVLSLSCFILIHHFFVLLSALNYMFYLTGDSQEDSVAVVVHKQPTGGIYQSFVCELFQPCAVPCSQLTSPGTLGWLLHSLEPSHETSGIFKSLQTWLKCFSNRIFCTPYVLQFSR